MTSAQVNAGNLPANPGGDAWTVWRIDDNGNTFVVRQGVGKADADRLVAEYTARGHKQTYWAEKEPADR